MGDSRLACLLLAITVCGCVSDVRRRLLVTESTRMVGKLSAAETGVSERFEAGVSERFEAGVGERFEAGVGERLEAGAGGAPPGVGVGREGGVEGGIKPHSGGEGGIGNSPTGGSAPGGNAGMMNVSPPSPPSTPGGACSEGTWDHDGWSTTPCIEHSPCQAGRYATAAGDSETDRSCAPCEDGSFSSGGDVAECSRWKVCKPGTYVAVEGSSAADRVCSDCEEGEFSDSPNAMVCSPWQSCLEGRFVKVQGTALNDRECATCSMGFTDSNNEDTCKPWNICAMPDFYQTGKPSETADRACVRCPSGEASIEDNADKCFLSGLVFQMEAGTVVIEAEHFVATDPQGSTASWLERLDSNASGGVIVELGPDEGLNWGATESTAGPRLDYNVNFTETGSFRIYVRGARGPADPRRSDTCWIGLDGVAVSDDVTLDNDGSNLHWVVNRLEVGSEGLHTLSIWGRDDGMIVDKVVLTKDLAEPTGAGPNESVRL